MSDDDEFRIGYDDPTVEAEMRDRAALSWDEYCAEYREAQDNGPGWLALVVAVASLVVFVVVATVLAHQLVRVVVWAWGI